MGFPVYFLPFVEFINSSRGDLAHRAGHKGLRLAFGLATFLEARRPSSGCPAGLLPGQSWA